MKYETLFIEPNETLNDVHKQLVCAVYVMELRPAHLPLVYHNEHVIVRQDCQYTQCCKKATSQERCLPRSFQNIRLCSMASMTHSIFSEVIANF
jgi:hypothetical protein